MARTGRSSSASLAEEALDDAVLEAVEGHDREAAAGPQRALGGFEALLELVEFGIEVNADRLEAAGRGIAFLAGTEAGGAADDRGKLGGALDRPRGNDGAGNGAGPRFLAVIAKDANDLGFVSRG